MRLFSVLMSVACLACLSISLTGCVSPIAFNQQIPELAYSPNGKVLVSVVDERKRVKEDGKKPSFIGIAHGAFGIPTSFHVAQLLATEDGDKERDLATWLQYRIANGLEQKGWQTEVKDYVSIPTPEVATTDLEATRASKLLALVLKEWYFSMNLNWVTAFNFDTNAEVYIFDVNDGNILTKEFKERDVIDEQASESPQNNVLRAYKAQLQQILNDPEVREALVE